MVSSTSTPNPMRIIALLGCLFLAVTLPVYGQLKVAPGGNIGLGTLIPKEAVQIGNSLTIHNGGSKALAFNFYFDGSNRRLIDGRANALFLGTNNIEFRTAANGLANSVITWSIPMLIYNGGVSIFSTYTSGTYKLDVGGLVRASNIAVGSDIRLKERIEPIVGASKIITRLSGRSYVLKAGWGIDENLVGRKNFGFIAQEVQNVLPELVWNAGDSLGLLSVNYDGIIPFLVEAFKEQERRVEALEKELFELRAAHDGGVTEKVNSFPNLSQNRPNPFMNSTQVYYKLPNGVAKAYIELYDMNGKRRRVYEVNEGEGKIDIEANDLEAGMFVYSLIVNNQIIESRVMVITELRD
jgi:hypothetical protein